MPVRHRRIVAALAVVGAVAALSTPLAAQEIGGMCACSREYRTIPMTVVDASGKPVTSWTATVRRATSDSVLWRRTSDAVDDAGGPAVSSGRTPALPEPSPAGARAGTATLVVIDDGLLDALRSPSDTLVVEVRSGGRRGMARVVVGYVGAPTCRCHVRLVQGPSRVTVR